MPLDADVRALLDELDQAGGKAIEDCTPAEARTDAWAWVERAGEPEDVAAVGHHFLPGPTADLPVRIYTPAGQGPFPAIVYFHGSGWTVHNIELADIPHRALANRTGAVVIAVNYQKAPEHRFPVPFNDAYAALEWVHANAARWDIDPARVGVGGDSAGGNLAAAVTLRARDAHGPPIAFQLLLYPSTNPRFDLPSMIDNAEGYVLTTAGVRWFWAQYLRSDADADNPYACPGRAADLSGLPPAIVITAEYDPTRDDGATYARLLREAGVPVTYRCYQGMVHGFFWTSGRVAGSRRLLDDLGRDVRALLAHVPFSDPDRFLDADGPLLAVPSYQGGS